MFVSDLRITSSFSVTLLASTMQLRIAPSQKSGTPSPTFSAPDTSFSRFAKSGFSSFSYLRSRARISLRKSASTLHTSSSRASSARTVSCTPSGSEAMNSSTWSVSSSSSSSSSSPSSSSPSPGVFEKLNWKAPSAGAAACGKLKAGAAAEEKEKPPACPGVVPLPAAWKLNGAAGLPPLPPTPMLATPFDMTSSTSSSSSSSSSDSLGAGLPPFFLPMPPSPILPAV
mmetsp:Transcript_57254/g.131201  ORF Transcript_57254/g.131201 Transcript_57254/m.131201 type:complete len:228 (-) Transcript_57254:26-709(-)